MVLNCYLPDIDANVFQLIRLLDLRQKQSSLEEAKASTRMANDSSRQGDLLKAFTIVTVMFASTVDEVSFRSSWGPANAMLDTNFLRDELVCRSRNPLESRRP